MKFLFKAYFLFILIILDSCSDKKVEKEYIFKIKIKPFDEKKMFDTRYVSDYMFDLQEANIDSLQKESKKYFLKAIDLAKNKKKPTEAMPLFKKSIILYPEAKTYYELANAVLDSKNIEEIKNIWQIVSILERLDYKPSSNISLLRVLDNYYTSLYDSDREKENKESIKNRAISLLISCFRNGNLSFEEISKNPRLSNLLLDKLFKAEYAEYLASATKVEANPLSNSFLEFANLFPKNAGEFSTTISDPDLKNYTKSIDYSFAKYIPEMENTSFGREVSNDFFYVLNLKQTDNYTALLYKSVSFYDSEGAPTYIMLATYNNNSGEQISKTMFSCDCSYEKLKTASFSGNTIKISDHKRTWKKDIKKFSIDENAVKEIALVNSYELEIGEDGQIIDKTSNKPLLDSTSKASFF